MASPFVGPPTNRFLDPGDCYPTGDEVTARDLNAQFIDLGQVFARREAEAIKEAAKEFNVAEALRDRIVARKKLLAPVDTMPVTAANAFNRLYLRNYEQ